MDSQVSEPELTGADLRAAVEPDDRERVERWLTEALVYDGGAHDMMDVWDLIARGDGQLWIAEEGCCVTQVMETPKIRYLLVWLAGGTLEAMRDLHTMVVAFAKSADCCKIVFNGRKGWERTFLTRDDGWVPTLVTFEKELNRGEG